VPARMDVVRWRIIRQMILFPQWARNRRQGGFLRRNDRFSCLPGKHR
jgi:hypothetical protein